MKLMCIKTCMKNRYFCENLVFKKTIIVCFSLIILVMVPSLLLAKDNNPVGVLSDIKIDGKDANEDKKRELAGEILIYQSEKKAINQINKLLKKYKNTPFEAKLLFRLAELYMRRAKSGRFFDIHRSDKGVLNLYGKYVKNPSSSRYLQKASVTYFKIQKKHPNFSQMDIVTFNNAFTNQQMNRNTIAKKYYYEVINKFPNSFLVPDSHLALGEMFYIDRDYSDALKHYLAIKAYPHTDVYPYALYKAAWAYYNSQNSLAALKQLEVILKIDSKINKKIKYQLRKETLKDIGIFYTDIYPSKESYSYFSKLIKIEEIGGVMLNLARIYSSYSRFKDTSISLNNYIKALPYDKKIPDAYILIIENEENRKQYQKSYENLKLLAEICNPTGKWRKMYKDKTEVIEICKKDFPDISLKQAKKWWMQWKKYREHKKYKNLSDLYVNISKGAFEVYLQSEAKQEIKNKNRFAYAELLFQSGEYDKASIQYSLVGKVIDNKKISHDASYFAIVSLEKSVNNKWDDKSEKRLENLTDYYIKNHNNGNYIYDIKYKRALIHYDKKRLKQAKELLKEIADDPKGNDKTIKAQDLYLDILNQEKNYVSLQAYSKKVMKSTRDNKRKKMLKTIFEQAKFAEITQMEEKGKSQLAVKEYIIFYKNYKNNILAKEALYNAIKINFIAGNLLESSNLTEKFCDEYSSDKRCIDMLKDEISKFEEMAMFSKTADLLVKLSKSDAKDSLKWLEYAGDLYNIEGENKKAISILNNVIDLAKNRDDKIRVLEKLSEIYQKEKDKKLYIKVLNKIISYSIDPYSSKAMLALALEHKEQKKYQSSFKLTKKIISHRKKLTDDILAKARFIQAEILEEEFKRQSLKSRIDRLALVLGLKTEKLEKSLKAYQDAMKYRLPSVQLKSFINLVDCYDHYIVNLKKFPRPSGISDKEYVALLQDFQQVSIPLEKERNIMIEQIKEFLSQKYWDEKTFNWAKEKIIKVTQDESFKNIMAKKVPSLILPAFEGEQK